MKAKLIDIGRQKFNGEVGFSTLEGLLRHIGKHLVSRNISIVAEDGTSRASIHAGFHKVGEVELVKGVFRVASHRAESLYVEEE